MNNAYETKNAIIKYSALLSAICLTISFFIIGFNADFARGLLIGCLTAFINMNLLYVFISASLKYQLGFAFNFLGYIARMSIYGIAIYFSLKTGNICAAGAVISFLIIKLSIYLINIKKIKQVKRI